MKDFLKDALKEGITADEIRAMLSLVEEEAKAEARLLMLGAQNILDPKSGKPIVTPSQDMVLGNYYLSIEEPGEENEGKVYKNSNEAIMAYERREITLHTRIAIPVSSFKLNLSIKRLNFKLVTFFSHFLKNTPIIILSNIFVLLHH